MKLIFSRGWHPRYAAPIAWMLVLSAIALGGLVLSGPRAVTAVAAGSTALGVPGRANAHVSLASSGRLVVAAWAATLTDGTTDVFVAVSRDNGAVFETPVRVNRTPGEARINGEQPPRVTISARSAGSSRISVLWTAKAAAGTVLLTAHSEDEGRTFGPSTPIPGTNSPGNRGWQAIGTAPSGRMHAVWLDHRRLAGGATHRHGEGHQATSHDGVAMAQQSDLYFDTLGDPIEPRAITSGVCYCCKTALAYGAAGEIYLAWRHVYPGNLRDIAFSASTDGGRTFSAPVRVSEDRWQLDGCPDDGPSLSTDRSGGIHLVWPAVIEENSAPVKALFYSRSRDGRTFTPRVRLPTQAQANHPQIAVGHDGTLLVAWDEAARGTRQVVWARGRAEAAGTMAFARTPIQEGAGVYPSVIASGRGALVAWTSGPADRSEIRVAQIQWE
ncbi:MAG: sialidase family protein [Vicinamibacterales bacterium]